jgi:hypothetical protein
LEYYNDVIIDTNNKPPWLGSYVEKSNLFFDSTYRGQGVKNFYTTQNSQINGYAAHIRKHIEEKMFAEWQSGRKSILEIEKYISLLISDCTERSAQFSAIITTLGDQINQEVEPEINRQKKRWDDLGWAVAKFTN